MVNIANINCTDAIILSIINLYCEQKQKFEMTRDKKNEINILLETFLLEQELQKINKFNPNEAYNEDIKVLKSFIKNLLINIAEENIVFCIFSKYFFEKKNGNF